MDLVCPYNFLIVIRGEHQPPRCNLMTIRSTPGTFFVLLLTIPPCMASNQLDLNRILAVRKFGPNGLLCPKGRGVVWALLP